MLFFAALYCFMRHCCRHRKFHRKLYVLLGCFSPVLEFLVPIHLFFSEFIFFEDSQMSWELFCVPFLLEKYFLKEGRLLRAIVIVNYELRPIILTLWNEFEAVEGTDIMANIAQNPVLISVHLRVTTDNYLSLSTQSSSVILVSPIVQEAGNLWAWFQANSSELTQMVHERSYANPCVLLPPVASSHISQISFIAQATKFGIMCHYCSRDIYTFLGLL